MRDNRIDVLRFLGLAMIILAHVGPSSTIFQLRNFDVPLMIIVSGMSFRASFKDEAYLSYLYSRIKRLLLPVWLFLSIYFLVIWLTGQPRAMPNMDTIISSYLLLEGIGYVWIIRVFLMVALIAPFIYACSKNSPSHLRFLAVTMAVYLLYELSLPFFMPLRGSTPAYIFENTILYLIPYSVVFAIGLRLPELGRNQLVAIMVTAFLLFAIWAAVHWASSAHFIQTQDFKYPPRSYYLSYAIFASTLAWLLSDKILVTLEKIRVLSLVLFIAQNSIWVYLWHIPLIEAISLPAYLKYPVVFMIATVMAFLQVELVKQHILPRISSDTLKKDLRAILTG